MEPTCDYLQEEEGEKSNVEKGGRRGKKAVRWEQWMVTGGEKIIMVGLFL